MPNQDIDQIVLNIKCFQGQMIPQPEDNEEESKTDKQPHYLYQQTMTSIVDDFKSETLKKLIGTMKRNEVAQF